MLAVVCAIAAALLIERGIAPPVRRLRAAAQQLGAGDLKSRSPVTGQGEIGELGAAFNRMAEQIAEREERLTELDRLKSEFVSSVSHELRTPLTTIKTLTRVLQRGGQTDDERREYLDTIAAECDRQITLVLNLLDLTRIEAGAYKVRRAAVYPAQLVTSCVAVEQHAASARGHSLAADLPTELPPVLTDEGAHAAEGRGMCDIGISTRPGLAPLRRQASITTGMKTATAAVLLTNAESALMTAMMAMVKSSSDFPRGVSSRRARKRTSTAATEIVAGWLKPEKASAGVNTPVKSRASSVSTALSVSELSATSGICVSAPPQTPRPVSRVNSHERR